MVGAGDCSGKGVVANDVDFIKQVMMRSRGSGNRSVDNSQPDGAVSM